MSEYYSTTTCVHSIVLTFHSVHDMEYTYCQSGIPPAKTSQKGREHYTQPLF